MPAFDARPSTSGDGLAHDILLLVFGGGREAGRLDWDSCLVGGPGDLAGRVAVEPAGPGEDLGTWLGALAARTATARRLVCAGAGRGALEAVFAGPLLGAAATLAIAPGPAAEALAVSGEPQRVEALRAASSGLDGDLLILSTVESAGEDRRLQHALSAEGRRVERQDTGLPAALLPAAASGCDWLQRRLQALLFERAVPAHGWSQAWSEALRPVLEMDAARSSFAPDGALELHACIRNRGTRPLDLEALAADGLALRASLVSAGTPGADLARLQLRLSAGRLEVGEAAGLQVSLAAQQVARAGVQLRIGLHAQGVGWLDPYGFPGLALDVEGGVQDRSPPDMPRPSAPARARRSPAQGPGAAGAIDRADVTACYRTFLGRSPESEAVVAGWLRRRPGLWPMIEEVLAGPESVRWRLYDALRRLEPAGDPAAIPLDVTAAERERLVEAVVSAWSRHGAAEPYASALANPDYLLARLTPERLEQFYDSGEAEVAALEAALGRNALSAPRTGVVLEFGCRVGRLAEPLRRRFPRYDGVDISPRQLELAEARAEARGLDAVAFHPLSALLEGRLDYDLFVSVLSLQHLPPPLMRDWLEAGLRRLRPGGIAYVQLPCELYDYRFEIAPYLDGRARRGAEQLHALPQREVFALLARQGLTPLEATPDARIGPTGRSFTFLARKDA